MKLIPLRERTEDIKLLADHFMKKYSLELNKEVAGFSDDAVAFLETRHWKGNIREFENAIQRAVLISRSDLIGKDDFMIESNIFRSDTQSGSLKDMEMDLIMKTLNDTDGNKTRAAQLLGVSVRTIRNKLNEYGKNVPVA
jgi:DNA-binding NtrC family response regulator